MAHRRTLSGRAIPDLSPTLLFDTLKAYRRRAALKAALELNLFTAIGEGRHTAGDPPGLAPDTLALLRRRFLGSSPMAP